MGWREGVVFSRDGSKVAAGGYRQARIWNARTGELLTYLAASTFVNVNSLAFDPDGRRVVTGCVDSDDLELWDVQTGSRLAFMQGHTSPVTGVVYSPDGSAIASASDDGTIRFWSPSGQCLGPVLRGHAGPVKGVAFSPDGRRIASIGSDSIVRLWNVASRRELQMLRGPARGVGSAVWEPDCLWTRRPAAGGRGRRRNGAGLEPQCHA